ncbi:transglycosylase SLT domain-containing protein [Candidatus Margulisiibacteriota bacterium]
MKFSMRIILAILIALAIGTSSFASTPGAREAFRLGNQLLVKAEYYPAIEHFKIALQDNSYPLLDYGYFYIAQAYQESNNPSYALQIYDIVIDYFKNSVLLPEALFQKARILEQQADFSAASRTLRLLIVQFPKHELIPHARYLLGQHLEKAGEYENAARVYQNLDLFHSTSDYPEKALERLDYLAKQKHVAGYEAPAASIYNLGVKYFKARNYTKAKGYFTRLSKFYKKSSFHDEAVMMLGRIHIRKGRLGSAVIYFKRARNLNKDSKPEAMYYLALTYNYQKSPQACVKTLEKVVSLFPKSHWAGESLIYLGRYYRNEKEMDLALSAYERLVSLHPDSWQQTQAIWHIGNIYYKKGNYQKSYEILEQAIKPDPAKATDKLLFWTAKSAEKIGKKDKAIDVYKTVVAFHDHSYYGYRAREELAKYGLNIKPAAVPDVTDIIDRINGETYETASHEQRYHELVALGLGDEAAEEASFIEEKVPLSQKDNARIAKYHAYIMKGKFAKPIHFADKKITEAMENGSLGQLDPRLWRFSYPRGYWKYVDKYSKMYGLDPYLVYAVIREESRFKSRALSRSWAHGLMQIIPSTGRLISRDLGLSYSRWKMYNPRVNIHMGTYYLASLIKRFDGNVPLALAGYNGGPGRVKRWLKKYPKFDLDEFVEDIPLRETRNYVKKVMKSYYGYKRVYSGG